MDAKNYDAVKNCAKVGSFKEGAVGMNMDELLTLFGSFVGWLRQLYLKLEKNEESVLLLKTMISPRDESKNFNIIHMICEIYNRVTLSATKQARLTACLLAGYLTMTD